MRVRGVVKKIEMFALIRFGLACCGPILTSLAVVGVAEASAIGARQIGDTECYGRIGECEGSGQLFNPIGVAVNSDSSSTSFGSLYVVDNKNRRISKFSSSSGAFELAWGSGVATGAAELQTCTTSCRSGRSETNPPYVTGGVVYGDGIAVDNDPSSQSSGDVYVVSTGTSRVEKFGPSGEFLLAFGGEVNETKDKTPGATSTEKDVCTATEKCEEGTVGSSNGQFHDVSSIAVGANGLVYVGDQARVQVFESTGAFKESISLSGIASSDETSNLAVGSSGDIFVVVKGVAGVHEFHLSAGAWSESLCKFDEGSPFIASIEADFSGHLFVGDTKGGSSFGFHVLEYNVAACQEVNDFAANTVRGGSTKLEKGKLEQQGLFFHDGMAFAELTPGVPELFVSEYYIEQPEYIGETETYHSSVWALPIPHSPVVEKISAKPEPRGSATVEAIINPESNETTYQVEYEKEREQKECEWANGTKIAEGKLPSGLNGVPVSARATGLVASTRYCFRVRAYWTNLGTTSTVETETTVESLPAAYLKEVHAFEVSSSSAIIGMVVNPLGSNTEYRVEYGKTESYGEGLLTGNVGEDNANLPIEVSLQDLSPATEYHYRVVLNNELGTLEEAGHILTTQPLGGVFALPDGRAWELVSPADKKGAEIEHAYLSDGNDLQASSNGTGMTYLTSGPHVGEEPHAKPWWSQVLSTRSAPGVWASQDLTLAHSLPNDGSPALEGSQALPEYRLFSEDLSQALVEPQQAGTPPLSTEATERTLYLRNNPACLPNQISACFTPLVTCTNTMEPCPAFGGSETYSMGGNPENEEMHFITATSDLRHVVFGSPFALISPANESYFTGYAQWNLYEWSNGRLQLINILPADEGGEATQGPYPYVRLAGGGNGVPTAVLPGAISQDGRRVAWDIGIPHSDSSWKLYVRDMVLQQTVRVGGPRAAFQWMNSDGSRVFYIEEGELFVCELGASAAGELECATTDLTKTHGTPAVSDQGAGVQEIVSDVSRDGSFVYIVATSDLNGLSGPVAGGDNLYSLRYTNNGWSTTFIATLSAKDEKDWKQSNFAVREGHESDLAMVTSRISPDGRYLAFMSERSLTGYDNTDVVSGQPDDEVFLYDAQANRLVCVSCDPTGARPIGVLDRQESLLVDSGECVWCARGAVNDHWLAGVIPTWNKAAHEYVSEYQPRYLSNSGRLFFDSTDTLVSQATNGLMDVYEYEPAGIGSCTLMAYTYGSRSSGCVSLVSSGTSGVESAFLDASTNGDDVFFLTAAKLVKQDYDNAYDVYDAHVCASEGTPCIGEVVEPPPCGSGDSCKPAPSPQPEIFGPAPSATFNGIGNVTHGKHVKRKMTRGRKLALALRRCRHERGERERLYCERRARKRYRTAARSRQSSKRRGGR